MPSSCPPIVRVITPVAPPAAEAKRPRIRLITAKKAFISAAGTPSLSMVRVVWADNFRIIRKPPSSRSRYFIWMRKSDIRIACESTVARAAPRMPRPRTKMNIGSRIILSPSPITLTTKGILESPEALYIPMKALLRKMKGNPNAQSLR